MVCSLLVLEDLIHSQEIMNVIRILKEPKACYPVIILLQVPNEATMAAVNRRRVTHASVGITASSFA
jgi:hypothetical protein